MHWVLGDDGHGAEWERVMHVDIEDAEEVWRAIAILAATAQVTGVRDLGRYGFNCEVDAQLTIGSAARRSGRSGITPRRKRRRAL